MKCRGARRVFASRAVTRSVVMAMLFSNLAVPGLVNLPAAAATATVEVVGSSHATSSDGQSSVTLERPVETAPNDVLVAAVAVYGDPSAVATPDGWSLIRADRAGNTVSQVIFVRVATAAEPVSYTWNLSGKQQVAAGLAAYSGVDTVFPVGAHDALTHTGGQVTAPSLPVVADGSRLLNLTVAASEGSVAPPAGMDERFEAGSPHPKNHKDVLLALADQAVSEGTTGTRTATVSPDAPSIGAALVLRPFGAPPPPDEPPPPDDSPGDAVLVGAGDIASCKKNDFDEETAQLVDRVVAENPNAVVFTTGDNVYEKGTPAEFMKCYDPTWGRHKARTRPVVGNHDYATSGASGYFGYFGSAAGAPGQGYYDYMSGGWHVVVLNSHCSAIGGCHTGSAQEQWLRARLTEVAAECTVAMWHRPLFSSGSVHGSDPALAPLWQALYDHGAELVINGHDHIYERFAPQTADGVLDEVFGLRQITAGLGGRSRYGFGTVAPNSLVRYSANYGVLKLTLRAGSYDFEMQRIGDAAVIDAGTGSCHGAPPAPPPPPPPPPGSGPITAVGSSSSSLSVSRDSITLPRPAGVGAGHVLVAQIVSNDDVPGFITPAGWTLVSDQTVGGVLRQAVYYRIVAGGNEPSAYTWWLDADTTRRLAGGLTAYSGVDTSSPVVAHAVSLQTTASTAVPAPSLSAPVAGAGLLHLAALNTEGSVSPPAGMTERWEAASPNPKNTRDALAATADVTVASAGDTGVRFATASEAGQSIGLALLLRPAEPA